MTPQSVEDCLQSALSSLYPPFEVTAPTLLSQVFSVLERTYREDPLRYTLEFLIPAKRILQNVQHQACSQYSGFLFFHEGWPLCLGDKILIQLSSLPWHFLKPGDFYLQVVPYLECSPRLVLKCLSQDGTGVQEIVVPESAHSFLFSAEWLNSINKDRSSVRLENCLAAVEEKVLRLHWSEVIYPRFIHKEGFIVGRKCPLGPIMPPLECRSPGDGGITSVDLVDPKVSPPFSLSDGQPGMINSSVTDSHSGSLLDCIEGEYVELSPPNKVNGGKIENYRDLWVSRAKTAPSRKGKKKGYQAWLHEKKPGKIGSLSTLKQRPQDTWEERLCTGATGDKGNATVDGQNYWDVDATEGHAEADLVTEWRTGLEVLQRDDSDEIHSERQNWGSSEVQTWVLRDYSLEKKEGSLEEDRTAPQETDILTKSEESPLNIDHIGEREPFLPTEISGDITSNCQRHVSGDNVQGSKQGQNDTMKGNLRSLVGNCPVDFQLGSLQKMLKNREDVNDVFCLAKESSVCKTDRTWADGQETTAIQEGLGENTTTEDTLLPSNETRQDLEKENNPTWNPITDTPQRTGRGRRKKRNKRGRGPLKTEANKGIIITSETKTDVEQEVTETNGGTKDNEERKLESEEKSDERQPEGLPPNAAIQSEDLSCMDLSNEPDKPSCPSPLPPVPPSPNLRCLHRDVNWDLMESGFICLTGGRDKENKALLVICPDKGPATYNHNDLVNAVSYLFSLLRPEFRDLGMTVIIDLRDCESNSECLLQMLKDNKDLLHNVIYCTLIVCDKENPATAPCDLLESNVSVVSATEIAKFVALEELPDVFGGERPYIPTESAWGQRSLVNLYTLCTDVLKSLEEVIKDLDTESTMDTEALITYHGDAMKKALNDERLQALQRDGGTLVARLQKLPYMRLFDPSTFDLYEKVDEALHRLVQLSNQRLQELEERLSPPEYCDRTAEDSLSLPDTSKHQYQLMEALEETRSVAEGHSPVTEAENQRLEVGVRIRGLEVSSRELADRTCSPPRGHVLSRGDGRGPDAPWGGIPKEGKRSPQRLLLDLLCSERSYVQCLRRSLEARRSCPASLALRGSLEQLLNFHTHFLRELQNCISQPLTVSYCFLQHADQLHLYSLYVKNRQKVELFLPAPSGSLKGRRKDQKDEEDSWAILQRPLEQLDQYQRFLSDLMQECDQEAEQERQSLCTARELVGSLVLHGKNLLAAEAIRGFEVDEKEHGRLLLKDVFTVLSGRKKSLRHVFLFQKLLLFSKLKSAEGGLETYGYKQSFKTADMGLTESAIEGDVKIELWFRRPKSRETVILQAENIGIKESWTNEITKLLWDQGGLNKDYRSQDTVSIASSHRSFLDIKAGFSAISERTVGALLTARGSRTRSSMALSSSDHSSPSPPSSLSFALTTGLSPRRLRSPGGVSHSDKINEESSETFTDHFSFSGGPVCLKSISPIREGERSKDLTIESIFPSTSV